MFHQSQYKHAYIVYTRCISCNSLLASYSISRKPVDIIPLRQYHAFLTRSISTIRSLKLFIIQFYNFHFDKSTFRDKVQHHVVSHTHLQRQIFNHVSSNTTVYNFNYGSFRGFHSICVSFSRQLSVRKKFRKLHNIRVLSSHVAVTKKLEFLSIMFIDLSIETDKKNQQVEKNLQTVSDLSKNQKK